MTAFSFYHQHDTISAAHMLTDDMQILWKGVFDRISFPAYIIHMGVLLSELTRARSYSVYLTKVRYRKIA